MHILIEIPESEIPKQQDIIEIPLHFIEGDMDLKKKCRIDSRYS